MKANNNSLARNIMITGTSASVTSTQATAFQPQNQVTHQYQQQQPIYYAPPVSFPQHLTAGSAAHPSSFYTSVYPATQSPTQTYSFVPQQLEKLFDLEKQLSDYQQYLLAAPAQELENIRLPKNSPEGAIVSETIAGLRREINTIDQFSQENMSYRINQTYRLAALASMLGRWDQVGDNREEASRIQKDLDKWIQTGEAPTELFPKTVSTRKNHRQRKLFNQNLISYGQMQSQHGAGAGASSYQYFPQQFSPYASASHSQPYLTQQLSQAPQPQARSQQPLQQTTSSRSAHAFQSSQSGAGVLNHTFAPQASAPQQIQVQQQVSQPASAATHKAAAPAESVTQSVLQKPKPIRKVQVFLGAGLGGSPVHAKKATPAAQAASKVTMSPQDVRFDSATAPSFRNF